MFQFLLVAIVISLAVNLALLVLPSASVCFVLPVRFARPLMTASSDALSSGDESKDRETLVPPKADGLSWLPPRREEREVQL